MSEREKMLAGEAYDSRDPELLALAARARTLLAQYALTPAGKVAARRAQLVSLFGAVGEGVWIEPPFHCEYGAHISIGAHTFINVNCVFLDAAEIHIGDGCLIGPGVQLLTPEHPSRADERVVAAAAGAGAAPYRTRARPVTVGNRVWLGAGSLVMPGVSIGDDVTIGAGSVVLEDVGDGVLAAGNPCRVIRPL